MQHHTHPKHPVDRITASLAAGSLACLVVLGGCGPQDGSPVKANGTQVPSANTTARTAPERPAAPVALMGEVRHIETLTERPKGTGVGAATGAVIGGVLGYQVGDGNGQKAATAAGAIGGGLLGNKIERDRNTRVVGYNVQVQLDNGQTRTFRRESLGGLQVGSRVKVEGASLQPA
ncbi:MAG: glycine zipper 2TM domain-containing protein [Rhizobacter sp.]|nr:glycine zipper 2TM domain-containing protein [Rhizobacter sp.]